MDRAFEPAIEDLEKGKGEGNGRGRGDDAESRRG